MCILSKPVLASHFTRLYLNRQFFKWAAKAHVRRLSAGIPMADISMADDECTTPEQVHIRMNDFMPIDVPEESGEQVSPSSDILGSILSRLDKSDGSTGMKMRVKKEER